MKMKKKEVFDLWCYKVLAPTLILLVLSNTLYGQVDTLALIVVDLALFLLFIYQAIKIQKRRSMVDNNLISEEEYHLKEEKRHKTRVYLGLAAFVLLALYFFIQLFKSGAFTHWYEYLICGIAFLLILWAGNSIAQD